MSKKNSKEPEITSWVVRFKATAIREVYCEGCTREQAENSTFEFAEGDEVEIECYDYEVTSVEPNN